MALAQGDQAAARGYLAESLTIAWKVGDRSTTVLILEALAGIHGLVGDPRLAARLFGAAESLRRTIDAPILASWRADYERLVAPVSAALGPEACAAALAEGRALDLEQAIGLALSAPAVVSQPAFSGRLPAEARSGDVEECSTGDA